MTEKYRDYFNIDPEYLPQVNEAIINQQPDLWKKFYPHETFVKLLKNAVDVISRKQKVSIWVEGAYGTGKSHAVLTLKKLLDASEKDTEEYFEKYKDKLSIDLFNDFQRIKSDEKKVLTVHRYGSSSIRNDNNLVSAIQTSISNALKEAGLDYSGYETLKDATIKWLSQGWAKDAFNKLLKEEYNDLFFGDDVDALIEKLNTYSGDSLQDLIGKIMRVGAEKQFTALTLDVDGLVDWIKAIIKGNNLKAIVFIWDEFTEYFRNNMRGLTGFQKLADLSGSDPFYLVIVTHNVTHIFPETDNDWKKITGRFINPICNIELPENMAFQLMGAAMEKNKDEQIRTEWNEIADDLYDRTYDSRQLVMDKANITDDELKDILPIHPYTALLLKHISSAFDSNQRSMFDFIKNDRGDEIKGFQWFIDNYGPDDDNPLLTIDMLWDFFYEKQKEYLSNDIKIVLDAYNLSSSKQLYANQKRVLKTVLLLQAISQRTGDTVELFIPNEKNLNNAFEGSDLNNSEPRSIADSLVQEGVLFKKPLIGGKFQYSALINVGNTAELIKVKEEQKNKATMQLVCDGELTESIPLSGALNLRFKAECVSAANFKSVVNRFRESDLGNRIPVVIAFARDDSESKQIGTCISNVMNDDSYGDLVVIDTTMTPLGADLLEQYADAMANSVVNAKQDRGLANQYESNAKDVLRKWKRRVEEGEFIVYSRQKPDGDRMATLELLLTELAAINRNKYPLALENFEHVTDTMWQSTSLPSGALCGAKQEVSGAFKSANPRTKLENYINNGNETGAWLTENYWVEKPSLPISKIKIFVDDMITNAFEKADRISISDIYEGLKAEPYGFMPCNLTAFVMGFLLKEYINGDYSWTDGVTSDVLNETKLKEMIQEIIKHNTTPIPRYKNKYIVTMTDDEKAFNEASSRIFDIDIKTCTTVEKTRESIRQKMKEYSFPIWCINNIVDDSETKTDKSIIKDVIGKYMGIANNVNYGVESSDSDIALSIGVLVRENESLIDDLCVLVNKQNCLLGMKQYISEYKSGVLTVLSNEISDDGQYINRVKKKFDADAANWVWSIDTANNKIDEVILEYQIIEASNRILPKTVDFDSTMAEWCDACGRIKISYLYAKNTWEELSEIMSYLYEIKRTGGQLVESKREGFLEQLRVNGERFRDFYNNQTPVFMKSCDYMLTQFTEEEKVEIYKSLPANLFTEEKAAYQSIVSSTAEKYVSEQGSAKIKKIWKDKTGTDTPRLWSNKYITPILYMVDDKEIPLAKKAFEVIGKKQPEKSEVEQALEFFEHTNLFDKLSDQRCRDEAFKLYVIKSYSVLLDDVDDVRSKLRNIMSVEPYDWYGLPEIENKIKQMAEYKYNESGCDKALDIIRDMDANKARDYLRELIKDNLIVGMEIIKNK